MEAQQGRKYYPYGTPNYTVGGVYDVVCLILEGSPRVDHPQESSGEMHGCIASPKADSVNAWCWVLMQDIAPPQELWILHTYI
jgi:hypothetical protein